MLLSINFYLIISESIIASLCLFYFILVINCYNYVSLAIKFSYSYLLNILLLNYIGKTYTMSQSTSTKWNPYKDYYILHLNNGD